MTTEDPVPTIDLNAELPDLQTTEQDEVMVAARREWKRGLIAFGIFVIMIGGTGWAYMMNNQKVSEVSQPAQASKPVDQQVSEPVVSVKPVFAIFNGSGIAGGAAKLKAKVEAAGYEVVEVGNAQSLQTGTTVEIGSALANQKDEILQVVGMGEYLPLRDTSLKYSVKVIIGK